MPALLLALLLQATTPGPIQDNSFLLEEAYNQEAGVVQHISLFTRERGGAWLYTFTQEWPVRGLRHQLSYTVPYASVEEESGGRQHGFGDLLLNYRYQLVGDGDAKVAVSPRLSVLLPTGSEARLLGEGSVGLQLGVPLSLTLGRRFAAHSNAGLTWIDRSGDSTALSLGQSVVWLAAQHVNAMVEAVWVHTGSNDSVLVSPGLRFSIDFANGLQIVPGIAVPLGVGPSSGERAVLFYLSFEHPFKKQRS
jgi:hypothetical protein